ncbi:hypothetical protein FO519_000787 [Halicephalobus sp. NKZ332]|nr:hypothetical protein FO519_000787 [Halicephalobus sp. NKZ332]
MKLTILVLFSLFCSSFSKDLVYVQAIWRHGDRAPDKLPYPSDKYTEDYWERGWGQLTNVGIRQLHDLGTFFRDRYVGSFVNSSFNYKEVYIRASDYDRAQVSAQSFVSGMFPPSGYDQWNPDLVWQPIPIHGTSPGLQDPLLKPTDMDCPKYDKLWEDKYKHPVNDEIKEKYGPVLSMLEGTTGYGSDLSIKHAAKLVDITREVTHNLSQPDWVNLKWPEYGNNSTLDIIVEIYRLRRMAQFDNKDLAKLRGGVVARDFIERLLNASKGNFNEATKMMLYSSHDGTLLALLYSMGIADYQLVPYAATIIFELSRDENGHYNVEVRKLKKNRIKIKY